MRVTLRGLLVGFDEIQPLEACKGADAVLTDTFTMGRHTGVTLEGRAILADFDPSERRLTVYGPRSEVLWRTATRCGL